MVKNKIKKSEEYIKASLTDLDITTETSRESETVELSGMNCLIHLKNATKLLLSVKDHCQS